MTGILQTQLDVAATQEAACYTLKSGLELIPHEQGGLLLSLRPLLAMRLNPQAFALLTSLSVDGTTAQAAAGLIGASSPAVSVFFDNLARRRLLARKPSVIGEWPSVSIIVPAHGRALATRACVESLLALDYPSDRLEIVLVDDASDPPLAAALAGLPVRLLRQEKNIGQSAARNLAASEARGDLLAFIDNDCIADSRWLRALVPYLQDPATGIVGGRVIAPPPTGPVSAFEAVRSPLDMGSVGGEVGPGEAIAYLPTCNLIVRRDLLLAQGGFDVAMRLGEDVDFIWRTLRSGARAYYAPEGEIVHYHRVQLWALLRRRRDYGFSEADLDLQHPQGRRVMPLPLVSMALLVAVALWNSWWPASAALLAWALTGWMIEVLAKRRRLRRAGAEIPLQRVAKAVGREHSASLYHLSANVTRYYSLPLLVASLFWLNLFPALAILLLIAPISDYGRLQPRLLLPAFVGLYWLEMLAYQLGVWRGCWKRRTLRPLLPRIRWRR